MPLSRFENAGRGLGKPGRDRRLGLGNRERMLEDAGLVPVLSNPGDAATVVLVPPVA
jgi:hypothetical protein